MEMWKDVEGFEGVYQISNFGSLRSLDRKVRSKGGQRTVRGQMLKPMYTPKGYLNKIVVKDGEPIALFIHTLVAKHFIGIRPDGLVIDHIDRNPRNNHVSNLRYVTSAENQQNRKDGKLTQKHVQEIKLLLKTKTQREIANMYGVRQPLISRIKTGDRWANV